MQHNEEDDIQEVEQHNETILEENKDTFTNIIGAINNLFECRSVKDYNGCSLIQFICETLHTQRKQLYVHSLRPIAQQFHPH